MQTKCVEGLVKNNTNVGAAGGAEVDELSSSVDDPSHVGETFRPTHRCEQQVCTPVSFAHLPEFVEFTKLLKLKKIVSWLPELNARNIPHNLSKGFSNVCHPFIAENRLNLAFPFKGLNAV